MVVGLKRRGLMAGLAAALGLGGGRIPAGSMAAVAIGDLPVVLEPWAEARAVLEHYGRNMPAGMRLNPTAACATYRDGRTVVRLMSVAVLRGREAVGGLSIRGRFREAGPGSAAVETWVDISGREWWRASVRLAESRDDEAPQGVPHYMAAQECYSESARASGCA